MLLYTGKECKSPRGLRDVCVSARKCRGDGDGSIHQQTAGPLKRSAAHCLEVETQQAPLSLLGPHRLMLSSRNDVATGDNVESQHLDSVN